MTGRELLLKLWTARPPTGRLLTHNTKVAR
jgi:hypothetical protein